MSDVRPINDPDTIIEALDKRNRIAIVGLSDKPHRDSFQVGRYMLENGYEIVPVHPRPDEVLGIPAHDTLREARDRVGEIDLVNLFLGSDKVMAAVEQAVEIGAKIVWMQLGVINELAAEKARQAGMNVVMDRCLKIEHARMGWK
jgi:hypothetical protein